MSGGGDRTSCDKFFVAGIDDKVQSFERACPKQQKISLFCEDHLVCCEIFANPNDCEANTPSDSLTNGHDKRQVFFFSRYANSLQRRLRNPCVFASGVYQDFRNAELPFPVSMVLHDAMGVKRSHNEASLARSLDRIAAQEMPVERRHSAHRHAA